MEYLFAFALLLLVILGMSVGVIFRQKPITGSCGGLNAVSGSDKCLVCKQPVDPDSPLREKLQCPRAKEMVEKFDIEK